MKRIVSIIFCFCVLTSMLFSGTAIVFADEIDKNNLSISAQAYVLMEADTGKIMLEHNMDNRMPMASTTKIMTALLALEYHDIDKPFTVDSDAIHVEGSSMGLVEGDVVTLRALSYGMLLESGNDAANATAYALAGDIDSFALMMNEKANELGMTNSSFRTPSGLDAENHYSTAYDMALLTRAALSNEDFLNICSTERASVSFGNPPYDRWMKNHNKLLAGYEGCIGVKTGFTKKAGRCLVSAAERDGMKLICVTLNAPNDWDDHIAMLDYGFENFFKINIAPQIDSFRVPVTGGEESSVQLYSDENAESFVVTKEEKKSFKQVVNLPRFLFAPVEKGERIGEIDYYLDGQIIYSFPLYVKNDIIYKTRK